MVVCVPRVSESELEVDGLAADILNKEQVSLGTLHMCILKAAATHAHARTHTHMDHSTARGSFPGLATIWEEERHRRQQLGLDTTLTPPPSPGGNPRL